MKTLLKTGFVLALGLLLHSSKAQAQVQVNINTPYWGPAVPPNVQYYYLPELDGYYDIYNQSYLFFDPGYGAWISSPVLPRMYAGYDPRFFHPVAIQYVGRQPWGYLRDHRRYCDQWGVRPGRYYGSNWPGHGYAVAPRGGYGPGYYGSRPYGQSGYGQNGYRDRDGYRDYRNDRDGRYDRDNRNGRNEDRDDNRNGRYDNQGGYSQQNQQQGHAGPGNQPGQGGWGNGGGRRGRVQE
ncbi:hypothetical protein [Hymenobacter sp. 102]|uniref:hypothetical protein n=1 Tax=Hymenobacter sp. 102 TaxID=3403152 RepID=UPI003CE6FFC0